jgi:hypothetical protein
MSQGDRELDKTRNILVIYMGKILVDKGAHDRIVG